MGKFYLFLQMNMGKFWWFATVATTDDFSNVFHFDATSPEANKWLQNREDLEQNRCFSF